MTLLVVLGAVIVVVVALVLVVPRLVAPRRRAESFAPYRTRRPKPRGRTTTVTTDDGAELAVEEWGRARRSCWCTGCRWTTGRGTTSTSTSRTGSGW